MKTCVRYLPPRGPVSLAYPQNGFVEQDPEELLSSVFESITEALAKAKLAPGKIAAIGITNQRETTLLWDRKTGKCVHPAIVWQCRRTEGICRKLRDAGLEDMGQERNWTGHRSILFRHENPMAAR
jgi:glycerol kinase